MYNLTDNYYYTSDGYLVFLKETIDPTMHLVKYIDSVSNGETFIFQEREITLYKGELVKADDYKISIVKHETLVDFEKTIAERKKEIKDLNKEIEELEKLKNIDSELFKGSKTFLDTFNVLKNTKRFIIIKENNYKLHIVDNLDKAFINYDPISDGSFSDCNKKLRKVEFIVYRDFSKCGNITESLYNYTVRLEHDDAYQNVIKFDANCETDIRFFDNIDEIIEIFDFWLLSDSLSVYEYVRFYNFYKFNISEEVFNYIKDKVNNDLYNKIECVNSQRSRYDKDISLLEEKVKRINDISIGGIENILKIVEQRR